jgi:hypothetical protein
MPVTPLKEKLKARADAAWGSSSETVVTPIATNADFVMVDFLILLLSLTAYSQTLLCRKLTIRCKGE